jgi:hypothetical protein
MSHQPVTELKRLWLQGMPLGLDIGQVTDDSKILEIKNDVSELKRRWLQGVPLGLAAHSVAKDSEVSRSSPVADASTKVHSKSNCRYADCSYVSAQNKSENTLTSIKDSIYRLILPMRTGGRLKLLDPGMCLNDELVHLGIL